jgi:hypothetical protein
MVLITSLKCSGKASELLLFKGTFTGFLNSAYDVEIFSWSFLKGANT